MVPHLVRAQSAYKDIRICSFHHTHTLSHTHARTHARAHTHTHTHTHTSWQPPTSLSLSRSVMLVVWSQVSGKSHCIVCGAQGGKMVECERCPRAIHTDCLDPPLPRSALSPFIALSGKLVLFGFVLYDTPIGLVLLTVLCLVLSQCLCV